MVKVELSTFSFKEPPLILYKGSSNIPIVKRTSIIRLLGSLGKIREPERVTILRRVVILNNENGLFCLC